MISFQFQAMFVYSLLQLTKANTITEAAENGRR